MRPPARKFRPLVSGSLSEPPPLVHRTLGDVIDSTDPALPPGWWLADGAASHPDDETDEIPSWAQGYYLEEIEALGEIGVVGTLVTTGHIRQETAPRYTPMMVRGRTSNPGLYEELWRSEPLILDAVQSHTEMLTSGIWRIQPPPDAPPAVVAWCEWMDAKREHITCTWAKFLEDAASFLVFGFAPFEIVWARDKRTQRLYAQDFAFREQSIVYEYVFDARGDRPLAVSFEAGGDHPTRFLLPFGGPRLSDHKLLWVVLNGRGNNLEGVSPLRPCMHYVQAKQVLHQIAAAAAEKYGAPITYIRTDPSFYDTMRASVDDEAMEQTRIALDSMQAVELGIFELPDGLIAETVGPPGQMPELLDLIQYYDQMIVATLSNEGSLLGLQAVTGSYALGEVKERDFLASGPANARRIVDAFNRYYLWPAFRHAFPSLERLPRLTFRIPGLRDRGSFLDNVARLFPNVPLADLPESLQRAIFDELGVNFTPDLVAAPLAPAPASEPAEDDPQEFAPEA